MKITVDATPLLLRSAGVKNYLYHWLSHLADAGNGHSVRLFPLLPGLGRLNHERSVLGGALTLSRLACLYLANLPGNPVLDWTTGSAEIFHVTNQVRQPLRGARLTATLHDMTCWLMPQLHTPQNVDADRRFSERVLKRAEGLMAVSENTRRDAIRILDLKPERVTTIHSGVAQPYFDATEEKAAEVRSQYRLLRPYVLYIGTIEPRKNVVRLLDAWKQLPADVRDEYGLVLAGPMGWVSPDTARRIESEPDVTYLRYIPEAEVPGLTFGASVFAYPSLYEGFGFPVAQAMACGVPVLTSNNSCLPEISGDAALHVDAKSPEEIRAGLERLLTSASLRAKLGARGRELAQQYRWEVCAKKSWEFFEKLG